jgi:autotransporter-associated beta strand protein
VVFGGAAPIYINSIGILTNLNHVIKDTANTVTLSAASSWIGKTYISNGVWQTAAANAMSPATAVDVAAAGLFNLANFNQVIGSLEGSGRVTLGTARLVTGGNGSNTTWSGAITGTGGLDKRGNSTMDPGRHQHLQRRHHHQQRHAGRQRHHALFHPCGL